MDWREYIHCDPKILTGKPVVKSDKSMNKKVTAVFDGEVLRLDMPLELTPDKRYVITIEESSPAPAIEGDAWDVLEAYAGSIEAPPDYALEHDHYLYSTPKLYSQQ